jgi:MFS family permease
MIAARNDYRLLFATRILRMFGYGFLSVILVLYLAALGWSEGRIGLLLSLTLIGDTLVSLWMTTQASALGYRKMLVAGALLMAGAGVVFAWSDRFLVLLLAATLGVISPSGYEVGPFLAIEQAALTQVVPDERRTGTFAWYNLAGMLATAVGSLAGGLVTRAGQGIGLERLAAFRLVLVGYAAVGLLLAAGFWRLSGAVEARPAAGVGGARTGWLGLHRSRGKVLRLSALFALDAFAGGFIVQSLLAYWFYLRFGVAESTLGAIFFGANLLAGLSSLLASRMAARFGLVNTMVFTHLPSNLLLMLVPLMPTLPWAIGLLLVRFSISQMDVPTRQSYTMAIVTPEERSAAAGVTGTARTVGASLAPALAGALLAHPALLSVPLLFAGGLKCLYDLLLLRSFRGIRPPEEKGA